MSSQVTVKLDLTDVVAISSVVDGAAIGVNLALLNCANLTAGVELSLLSLQPVNAAAVPIAPSGKNGTPANHFKISRRLG